VLINVFNVLSVKNIWTKKITKINYIIPLKARSVCFSFSHLVLFKALAIRLISYVLSCLNLPFFTRSDRHPKISGL